MNKIVNPLLFIFILALFYSCSNANKEAETYLSNIQNLYEKGEYEIAKQKIDSIKILYPKAFDQMKAGMALLHNVRKAENEKQIAYCDSMITFLSPKIDSAKQHFIYERNKEYQDNGRFLPKSTATSVLASITLRSGVMDNGSLFIESVYIGGGYHDRVRISTKDGLYAETSPVTDEGLNFRFTDSGKQYEVITFTKNDVTEISHFIYNYADQPLTVSLKGKSTTNFVLSRTAVKAICSSYELSELILQKDSLQNVKEKSEMLIKYLAEQERIKSENEKSK